MLPEHYTFCDTCPDHQAPLDLSKAGDGVARQPILRGVCQEGESPRFSLNHNKEHLLEVTKSIWAPFLAS